MLHIQWIRTEATQFLLWKWSLLFFLAIKRSMWCIDLHFDINKAMVKLRNFERKIR